MTFGLLTLRVDLTKDNHTFPNFTMKRTLSVLFCVTASALLSTVHGQFLDRPTATLAGPDWSVDLDSYGYSDILLDSRAGFLGREYLSGEWATAVGYTSGGNEYLPTWLPPQFIFPDWESNSDFGLIQAIGPVMTGTKTNLNADGFPIFTSIVGNVDLRVEIRHELVRALNGTPMGVAPRTATKGGSAQSSSTLLKQTYRFTNVSRTPISNVRFFMFLHCLEAKTTVFDDRLYAGTLSEYRYDLTQSSLTYGINDDTGEIVKHADLVTGQSKVKPVRWENGTYGLKSKDSHGIGKPSQGVHLDVENDALNLDDWFSSDPVDPTWVSGAQRFDLGSLNVGATLQFDTLLGVRTDTTVVAPAPEIRIVNVETIHDGQFGDYLYVTYFVRSSIPLGYYMAQLEQSDDSAEGLVGPFFWMPLFGDYQFPTNPEGEEISFYQAIDPEGKAAFFRLKYEVDSLLDPEDL